MITNLAAGSTAVVVSLPQWGFAQLDANGWVVNDQLAISVEQLRRYLRSHSTTGITWEDSIDQYIRLNHSNTTDALNVAWSTGFLPLSDPLWGMIQTVLNDVTGNFTASDLAQMQIDVGVQR